MHNCVQHDEFFTQADNLANRYGNSVGLFRPCDTSLQLRVTLSQQRLLMLGASVPSCEVCRCSANVMCRLLEGADIGLFSVFYHQIQNYLLDCEALDSHWGEVADIPLTKSSVACLLKPWRKLQKQLCEALKNTF